MLIVYRHVLIGIQRGQIEVPEVLVDANMIFYSFRMPLFFILSGIFISRSLSKRSVGELGWIKFEALLYPYLVWTFIQISLQIALSGVTNSDRSWVDYTYILYQPRILDQFWYLPALFNTTIIYLFFKSKLKVSNLAQLALGVGFYFLSPYFQSISMLSDWMEFYLFFAIGDSITHLFFSQRSQRFFKNPYSLLVVVPLFIASQFYYMEKLAHPDVIINYAHGSRYDYLKTMSDQLAFLVIALIGCISMFVLAFRLQQLRVLSFLRVLGYHSLYIYVMHVIVSASTRLGLIIVFGISDPVVLLTASIAMGVIVPIVVYNLLIKDSYGWFLFCFHRKKSAMKVIIKPPVSVTEILIHKQTGTVVK